MLFNYIFIFDFIKYIIVMTYTIYYYVMYYFMGKDKSHNQF